MDNKEDLPNALTCFYHLSCTVDYAKQVLQEASLWIVKSEADTLQLVHVPLYYAAPTLTRL